MVGLVDCIKQVRCDWKFQRIWTDQYCYCKWYRGMNNIVNTGYFCNAFLTWETQASVVFPKLCSWACALLNLHFSCCPHCFSIYSNWKMIPNSFYSSIRLILIAVLSIYSNARHLLEAGSFTLALLSTPTRLKSPALEPHIGGYLLLIIVISIQGADASHLAITSQIDLSCVGVPLNTNLSINQSINQSINSVSHLITA